MKEDGLMAIEEKKQIQKKIQRNYRKVLNEKREITHNNKRDIFVVSIFIFFYVLYNVISGPGL